MTEKFCALVETDDLVVDQHSQSIEQKCGREIMQQHQQAGEKQVLRAEHMNGTIPDTAANHFGATILLLVTCISSQNNRQAGRQQQKSDGHEHHAAGSMIRHNTLGNRGRNNGAGTAPGHNKTKKPLRLPGAENVRHETPEY